MPVYVVGYLLLLAAASVFSWQLSERSGLAPAWLRNGDLAATAAAMLLTIAYWNEELRDLLGGFAIVLLAAVVGWIVFAVKPSLEIGFRLTAASTEQERHVMAWSSVIVVFAFLAPALFCGWRVALAAVDP